MASRAASPQLPFQEVSAGGTHTCAIDNEADAWCWGRDLEGQLGGNGSPSHHTEPVKVALPAKVESLSTGFDHTCVVDVNASGICFGTNNKGQLGRGGISPYETPGAVSGVPGFVEISAGRHHSCGIAVFGQPWCWGENDYGQIGTGGPIGNGNEPIPVMVTGLTRVTDIEAGVTHSCAVDDEGAAWCWGDNSRGQLGVDPNQLPESSVPVEVVGINNIIDITIGGLQTCAIDDAQRLYCWGNNNNGQLGRGTFSPMPHPVPALIEVNDVNGNSLPVRVADGGNNHTCFIVEGLTGYCVGSNISGQLASGHSSPSSTPSLVIGTNSSLDISAGYLHTCVIDGLGDAFCTGENGDAQLGDGSYNNREVLVPVNVDTDGDGIYDAHDNCRYTFNPDQADADENGIGDACDEPHVTDSDGDGVPDDEDNCPAVENANQADADGDGVGDACDGLDNRDVDGDGVFNEEDNCPTTSNADQADFDRDGTGDICDGTNDCRVTLRDLLSDTGYALACLKSKLF
jgi:alpha-tubulin suppressor-like RCC1 family protein